MNENLSKFHTIINKIDLKMMRKNEKCWIKIVPLIRISIPSSLHFILNNEYYNWDIFDKNGREAHKVYFEGFKSAPSFYLKSGEKSYRITFNYDGISVIPITKAHKQDNFVKENCHCISSQTNCWAKAVYYTSRPDKPPFDEM